jgi:hypothetical protein
VQFFPLADPTRGTERARQMGFDAPARPRQPTLGTPPEVISWVERIERDREASAQVPTKDDTRRVWPFRGIDHDSLDRLAIISLAGVMSELIECGDGLGGFADLQQLRGFLNSASVRSLDKQFLHLMSTFDFQTRSVILPSAKARRKRQRVPSTMGLCSIGHSTPNPRWRLVRARRCHGSWRECCRMH